jgi:hypothetical protein
VHLGLQTPPLGVDLGALLLKLLRQAEEFKVVAVKSHGTSVVQQKGATLSRA